MAVVELDPVFLKALKFLHSNSRDSADQLKQLLDDAISQRKGNKPSTPDTKPPVRLSTIKQQEEDKAKKREAEKRNLDKLKQDISSLSDEVPVPKKPRRDSPQASSSPSRARVEEENIDTKKEDKSFHKEKEKERTKKDVERKIKAEKEEKKLKDEPIEDSDEGEKSIDADDFAFGLGIACVVCNRFDVTSGNQLVECQECHTLYHQECHRPPVTEQDVNDPRFVWYCSRCTKTMKKLVTKPGKTKPSGSSSTKDGSSSSSSVTVSSSSSSTSATSSSTASSSSSKSKPDPSTLFSFRRVESKSSSSKDVSNNSGNRPLSGLASLAANLSGKGEQSKSSTGRSDSFSKSLLKSDLSKSGSSKHDRHEQGDKVSLLSTSKNVSSSSKPAEPQKSGGGGIKLGIDIFKNLPKVPESSRASSKTSQSGSKLPSGSSGSSSKQMSGSSSSSIKQVSGGSSSKQSSGSSSSKPASGSSSSSIKLTAGSSSSSSKQSTGGSGSSNKQGPGGASSVVNADKRLQMMKKKAAAKLHEKRASLK